MSSPKLRNRLKRMQISLASTFEGRASRVEDRPLTFQPLSLTTQSMNAPGNYSTFVVLPSVPDVWRESPKLRQQKLDAALALKAEATTLLEADGGTFTRQHEAYVRRKARAILSWRE